jgi:cellulose synthase/poly-beta-1,6-N-acetylglucosamine synthase-like glycosyltransferase
VKTPLEILAFVALTYVVVLNALYIVFTTIAWRGMTRHRRERQFSASAETFSSPLTPPVSVILPAYNEEAGIVESVRSLLALRYPQFEVVVISDGSTDGTIAGLKDAFDLVPVRKALRGAIPTAPVRTAYVSRRHPELSVVDKDNGGKADALNCGVNAARYPYVCAIDADAILEEDALIHVTKPILDDPELVAATGGIVRIANGCVVEHGRVTAVRLPSSGLAAFQVVEYLRAFLVGRVGWSRIGSLLIISGAFGVFRRSLVDAVGGWATDTVGEDLELVVRLHRYLRERDEDYRIEFVPDPVCWTEVPEDLRQLSRQRRRWQRGLAETLWRHRAVWGKPRYGLFGLLGGPYFVAFELFGPVLQVAGYPVVAIAFASGAVSTPFLGAFLLVTLLLGVLLSLAALALEEVGFGRYARGGDAARLVGYAVLENLGYRQVNDLWRLQAFVDLAGGRREWGEMQRRGFGPAAVTALEAPADPEAREPED